MLDESPPRIPGRARVLEDGDDAPGRLVSRDGCLQLFGMNGLDQNRRGLDVGGNRQSIRRPLLGGSEAFSAASTGMDDTCTQYGGRQMMWCFLAFQGRPESRDGVMQGQSLVREMVQGKAPGSSGARIFCPCSA